MSEREQPQPADDPQVTEPATDAPDSGGEPEPPQFTRVCRRCAAQATTASPNCPACGARYARRRPPRKLVAGLVGLVAVLALGGVAALVVADRRADQRERDRIALKKQQAREQQAREAEAEKAAEEFEESMLELREAVERDMRGAITKDAQGRYSDGILDDRASHTSCENVDGNREDLDETSGEYSCIAVTNKTASGSSEGYRFTARVNYEDGSYTWHLGD